jgi:hypothetical protein
MGSYRVNTKVTTSFALFTSCKIIHNHFLTYQWTFNNLCANTQLWNKLLRDLNLLKIEVFWDVMPWRTVCSDWCLEGTNIRRNPITISQSNGRYVPQDLKFQDTFYYALSLWSVFFFYKSLLFLPVTFHVQRLIWKLNYFSLSSGLSSVLKWWR